MANAETLPADTPVIDLQDAPKKRRSRAELEALVIEAAIEVLASDGLGLRPDSLTYARVFDHIKRTRGILVTRGSVHERIWDSQHHFQVAVLVKAVEYEPSTTYEEAFAAATPAVEAFQRGELGAMDAAREAIRLGCLRHEAVVDQLSEGHHFDLIRSALRALEPSPIAEILRETLTAAMLKRRAMLIQRLADLFDALELDIKPECGLDREAVFTLMTDTLETLDFGTSSYRSTSSPHAYEAPAITTPQGAVQQWNFMGINFWALTQMLLEPR